MKPYIINNCRSFIQDLYKWKVCLIAFSKKLLAKGNGRRDAKPIGRRHHYKYIVLT